MALAPLAWIARSPRLAALAVGLLAAFQAPSPMSSEVLAAGSGASPRLQDESLLRAGREVPAGLTAARRAERERELREAQEELRAAFAPGDARREPWLARLRSILVEESHGGGSGDLWIAAANVAGLLDLRELDEALAAALTETTPPRRRQAAERALYRLYGSWFTERSELDAFRAALGASPGSELLLQRQRRLAEELAETTLRLLHHEPSRALSALSARDPRVRTAAAAELGKAAVAARAEREPVLEALFARLRQEPSPAVLHELLKSLHEVLEAEPAERPGSLEQRRRLLLALESMARDGVSGSASGAELSLAQLLSRLAWGPAWSFEDGRGLPRALELMASLLRRMVGRGRWGDADVLIGVVDALGSLASRCGPGEGEEERLRSRLSVLEILQDSRWSGDVRLAAARATSSLALGRDVAALIGVLDEQASPPALQFLLLSTLSRLAPALEPGSEEAERLLASVLARIEAPDVDLRRRALSFLAAPETAHLIAGRGVAPFLARLSEESVADLRVKLLERVRVLGEPEDLEELLRSPAFDALAAGDGALLSELSATLAALTGRRPQAVMSAAERLTASPDEASWPERLVRALQLVADLPLESARALTPLEHRRVVEWASRLRARGSRLESSLPQGRAFTERVLAVHVPLAKLPEGEIATDPGREAERHYVRALLQGDLRGQGPSPERDREIAAGFAKALELAPAHPDPLFEPRVRRDRARHLVATRGDAAAVCEEYRWLVGWERARGAGGPDGRPPAGDPEEGGIHAGSNGSIGAPDPGPEPSPSAPAPFAVLDLTDLRHAARAELSVSGVTAASHARAFAIGAELVRQRAWLSEPGAVRLADLRELLDRALGAEDADSLALLARWLEPAPEGATAPQAPEPGAPAPPAVLWRGLDTDATWRSDLERLRNDVRDAQARSAAARSTGARTAPPSKLDARAPDGLGRRAGG